jgi:predicted dehydrogenase
MRPQAIKIAIVGFGKIARDQHLAALRASDAFELLAVASPHSRLEGVPCYADIQSMLQAVPAISAIALCTTPQVRYHAARYALQLGRHVLLEKPPGMGVSEVLALVQLARQNQLTLFASWHSRHARCVEPAREWLAGRIIRNVRVVWKEDVRIWHPGQAWIWKAGGLGVFDPGINALSILTRIMPEKLFLSDAQLTFPSNCETPIAATLKFEDAAGVPVHMELDFLHPGPPSWDIDIETVRGCLRLSEGGGAMAVDDLPVAIPASGEYPNLYAHFAQLVQLRGIDADLAPLQLVADAFLCGRRVDAEPFVE